MTANRLLLAACMLWLCFFAAAAGAQPTRIEKQIVPFAETYAAGTIVIKTNERRLYLALGGGQALRYPVGVGRAGMQWSGHAAIAAKYLKPPWSPPKSIRGNRAPSVIPGGSPRNPMGAAAMTLTGGEYAIHGTNEPGKVGTFVSHGCIRMYNEDVLDLMSRVRVGTPVIVIK